MNDFIFNVQPQAMKILLGQPFDALLPPLFGAFFGVVLGFIANSFWNRYLNHETKLKFIDMFHKELVEAGEKIEKINDNFHQNEVTGNFILPISINLWTTSLNSGALKLFSSDEAKELSNTYSNIMEYNEYVNNYLITLNTFPNAVGQPVGRDSIISVYRRKISACSKDLKTKLPTMTKRKSTLEKAKKWNWWKLWSV
ncbi:MAG: hypothetical protein PHG06_12395 [Parabacteroides sp.]|nr:hypothetical protein [Parabacteroides sp.]